MTGQAAPAPGPGGGRAGDAIHDIGFRHYTGERAGRGWITRSLLVDTLRGVFGLGRPARSKVMPWVLVGILVLPPVVIALSVLLTGGDELPVSYTQYLVQLQLVFGLFLAAAAPYAVSRDLRHGVMPLYLSRPLMRTDYIAARFGGLVIALFLVMAAPQTLLLVGGLLAKLPAGEQLVGWVGGLLASALLAVLLAAVGLAIAAFTPRRGLGVAAVITILLVISGVSAALTGISESQGLDDASRLAGAIDPFRLVDGLASGVLGVDEALAETAPVGAQVVVYAAVYVLVVAVAGLLLVRRYRKAGGL